MTFPKLILALACLMASTLMGQEAKVTDLFSKDLANIPGKEGAMMIVDYPPGSVDPIVTMHMRLSMFWKARS